MSEAFGPYQLVRRLGGDDAHDVFVGKKEGEEVIVSFVALDDDGRRLLEGEVTACRGLRHPAILPVIELVEHDGQLALIHPAVNGRTLASVADRLRDDGERLSDSAIWFIGSQLASALAAAHRLARQPPIVHGGLSPEHVILTWDGQVRLVGLGASGTLSPVPAPPWSDLAPPEVQKGKPVTADANCFTVAALLWWMVSGELPPDSPPAIAKVRPDIPTIIGRAIDRGLSRNPRERGSCAVMGGALSRHHEGGRAELVWNMEIFRALDVIDDELPSSHAFPTSRPPRSSHPTHMLPPRISLPEEIASPKVPKGSKDEGPTKRSTLESPRDDLLGRTSEPLPISIELARDAEDDDLRPTPDGGRMFDVAAESEVPPSDRTEEIALDELERRAATDAKTHERATRQQIAKALALLEEEEARRRKAASREPMFPAPDSKAGPRSEEDITREMVKGELDARLEVKGAESSAKGVDSETPDTKPTRASKASPARPRPVVRVETTEVPASEPDSIPVDLDEERGPESPPAPEPRSAAHPLSTQPLSTQPRSPQPLLAQPLLGESPRAEPRFVEPPADPLRSDEAFPSPSPRRRLSPPATGWGGTPPPRPRKGSTLLLGIVVAVVSIIAFAGGVWITGKLTASTAGEPPAPSAIPTTVTAASPPSPSSPSPLAPEPSPTTSAEMGEPAPATPASAEVSPAPGMGFLRVQAPVEAGVYVQGEHVGNVGEPIELPCRMVFVRIGRVPLTAWYNRGQAVEVVCGTETVVKMEVEPSP